MNSKLNINQTNICAICKDGDHAKNYMTCPYCNAVLCEDCYDNHFETTPTCYEKDLE